MRAGLVGEGSAFAGPFGPRPLIYADYTASGRSLDFIEEAIRRQVQPFYGNTHTETSHTGMHTTRLRESARAAVRAAVGAGPEHAVIFTGAGATAAIDKFARLLAQHPGGRPLVLIGPHEHHSNDLIWREAACDTLRIPMGADGAPDLAALAEALRLHRDRPLKVGAFAAASNVTGLRTDLRAIARMMHAAGGLIACDFAAAGPYVSIGMAGSAPTADDHLDAVFLSPHKFAGGPGASGVLVVDRALCDTPRPTVAGGGTVSYVTADRHSFVAAAERREEAGTPAILGDIRAGMVLRLKDLVGTARIHAEETRIVAETFADWGRNPRIRILGPQNPDRLGIFALNVVAGRRMLHHNLVVALLNDLFGIQARGGCSCAGPYGHALLGLDRDTAARHEALVAAGHSLFRPGWARIGLNWLMTPATCDHIRRAVAFVADHGADLMRLYRVDSRSGIWRARGHGSPAEPTDIASLLHPAPPPELVAPDPAACFDLARDLVAAAREMPPPPAPDAPDPAQEAVRWFWWPHEAEAAATGGADHGAAFAPASGRL
ncbi:aminotransferase class V-fold PLP-dependent enzyme [Plastorhodobacter daqingensis]|uniref:Aminotransferase class V-fold PLP-dependent enzyme n=1 Tax=Plastorhodobacter daqingensis TaxID=1387281 RepID=A0ABW2UM71_9RHOB